MSEDENVIINATTPVKGQRLSLNFGGTEYCPEEDTQDEDDKISFINMINLIFNSVKQKILKWYKGTKNER